MKDKVIVITGASQGIGLCLSRQLAKAGAKVILLARSKERLSVVEKSLQQQNLAAESIVVDLTSENEIKKAFQIISNKYPKVDILVNNAGVGLFATVGNSALDDSKAIFATNFFAPLLCTQQCLPLMRNEGGLIVNISSAISKYSSSLQGVYAASKSALDRLSEALRIEESQHRIKVLSVYVDRTNTNFKDHLLGIRENYILPFKKLSSADPEAVAAKIISAMSVKKSIYHTTYKSRWFTLVAGIAPSLLYFLFKKQFNLIKQQINSRQNHE